MPTLHELAHLIARWRAIDLAVFEACGQWTADPAASGLPPFWAAVAQHHAWHAQLWADRFPVVLGLDLDAATAAASTELGPIADDLAAAPDPPARVSLVCHRIQSELVDELSALLAGVDPSLDAPTHRVASLVLADLQTDIERGTGLLRAAPTV